MKNLKGGNNCNEKTGLKKTVCLLRQKYTKPTKLSTTTSPSPCPPCPPCPISSISSSSRPALSNQNKLNQTNIPSKKIRPLPPPPIPHKQITPISEFKLILLNIIEKLEYFINNSDKITDNKFKADIIMLKNFKNKIPDFKELKKELNQIDNLNKLKEKFTTNYNTHCIKFFVNICDLVQKNNNKQQWEELKKIVNINNNDNEFFKKLIQYIIATLNIYDKFFKDNIEKLEKLKINKGGKKICSKPKKNIKKK